MKTAKVLLRFYNRKIKQIMKFTLSALVCGAMLLPCTASVRANAESGQSENGTSVSEAPVTENTDASSESTQQNEMVSG